MQEIIKYKSYMGAEFDSKEECFKYEKQCDELQKLFNLLPKLPKDKSCKFGNGEGYLEVGKENYDKVKQKLLEFINDNTEISEDIVERAKNISIHSSILGRYLCDGSSPLYKRMYMVWLRLMCIDDEYHEWGQPYYAIHPGKGKQILYVEDEE